MKFNSFLKSVTKILKEKLPAEEAHIKLSPPERNDLLMNLNYENTCFKKAAVMMLFYPKNEITHFVLIKRNSYEGVHSAQIAFPGGKVELLDDNYSCTALRETKEEIGVQSDLIEIIQEFSRIYIPPSNFMVYPFFGVSKVELEFKPDPREVCEIIEVPLSDLLNHSSLVNIIMDTSYSDSIKVPVFKFDVNYVWGATAMILSEVKDVLNKVFEK